MRPVAIVGACVIVMVTLFHVATASPPPTLAEIAERARAMYPGDLLEAEIDHDDGRTVYELELRRADGTKVELEFDAGTGELLETRTEHDEAYRLFKGGQIVALEQIVADAEKRFSARFLDVELEDEDDRYRYEVELIDENGRKLEAVFDATTGELIEVEED